MERKPATIRLLFLIFLINFQIHGLTIVPNYYVLINENPATDYGSFVPADRYVSSLASSKDPQDLINETKSKDAISSETIVVDNYENAPKDNEDYSGSEEDPEGPPDHVIPYSEHEEPREVPVRPNYTGPGVWAKPPPERNIPLDFVPTKLYAQVRGSHTVKKLPKKEAIKSAKTDEEKENAPRLREVVTNSKKNTVYTEEGYEDSAYDHAGHIRDADFHEGFARKLRDQLDSKKQSGKNQKKAKSGEKRRNKVVNDVDLDDYDDDYRDHYDQDDARSNIQINPNVNPKLVAENGIEKLQSDVENEAEETEKKSERYEKENVRDSYENYRDSSKSDRSDDDYENADKYQPVKYGAKISKNKSENSRENIDYDSLKKSAESVELIEARKPKHKKKKNYPATTPWPRQATELKSDEIYETKLSSEKLINPEYQINYGQPTASSYPAQGFLDYLKEQQKYGRNSEDQFSTLDPQIKNQELTTGNFRNYDLTESTTVPSAFIETHALPQRYLPEPTNPTRPVTVSENINNDEAKNDDNYNFPNPWLSSPYKDTYDSWKPIQPEVSTIQSQYSTYPRPHDGLESDTSLQISRENISENKTPTNSPTAKTNYENNPFLHPQNTNPEIKPKKSKYKVLVRHKPKETVKDSPRSSQSDKHLKKLSTNSIDDKTEESSSENNKPISNYEKVLNYLKAHHRSVLDSSFPGTDSSKSGSNEDDSIDHLTVMKPPSQQFGITYANVPDHASYSPVAVSQPSVSYERASSQENNWKGTPSHNQYRIQSHDVIPRPFSFAPLSPPKRSSFPSTRLLPPSPYIAKDYAKYASTNIERYAPLKPTTRYTRTDNLLKLAPIILDLNKRIHGARRKRSTSDNGEIRDVRHAWKNANTFKADSVTNNNEMDRKEKKLLRRRNVVIRRNGTLSEIDSNSPTPDLAREYVTAKFRNYPDKKNGDSFNIGESIGLDKEDRDIRFEETRKKGERHVNMRNPISSRRNYTTVRQARTNPENFSSVNELKTNVTEGENDYNSSRRRKKQVRRKSHQELLNEAPKISSDVIDREINERFNKDKEKTNLDIKEKDSVEAEAPDFDYVDELVEHDDVNLPTISTEPPINFNKYPFYKKTSSSTLEYIVDPKTIPKKTAGGMEFYDSRNAYKDCEEVEPNLDKVLPEEEEPVTDRGLKQDLPRLRGLGDKLDCFKAKYFDENPFDNPLFAEKQIDQPTPPTELDPKEFSSRILHLPEEDHQQINQRQSKKPERRIRRTQRPTRQFNVKSIHVDYKLDPQSGRNGDAYLHSVRSTRDNSRNFRRLKSQRTKRRPTSTTTELPSFYPYVPYQKHVYDDVMGNIKSLSNSYQVHETTSTESAETVSPNTVQNGRRLNFTLAHSDKKNFGGFSNNTVHNSSSTIEGLLPPPVSQAPSRTSRHSNKSRTRSSIRPNGAKIIGRYQKIRIYKRSLEENNSDIESEEKSRSARSTETKAEETDLKIQFPDLLAEESNRRASRRSSDIRNTSFLNSAEEQKDPIPQRTVYTIMDRIRYSKPKKDIDRSGKFTGEEIRLDEDIRRKEPRYHTKNRKNFPEIISTTSPFFPETTTFITSKESDINEDSPTNKQQKNANYSPYYNRQNKPTEIPATIFPEVYSESKDIKYSQRNFPTTTAKVNTYDVREVVDESIITTTLASLDPVTSAEYSRLKTYLNKDPPGYKEAFLKDSIESTSGYGSKELKTPSTNFNSKSKEDIKEEEATKKEDQFRSSELPFKSAESSVENSKEETDKINSEEKEENTSKENSGSTEDHQAFFKYSSRPVSPAENFEDDRYAHIGPRINKPTFYHPPFDYSANKKNKSGSEEESSESEEETEYQHPWQPQRKKEKSDNNDSDRRRSRQRYKYLGSYEYPWEKRERLDAERQRRKKQREEYNKWRKMFSEEDEDDENSGTNKRRRFIYPWDKYEVPSRNYNRRNHWHRDSEDDSEGSSEFQPAPKFSSRYKSSSLKPSSDDLSISTTNQAKIETAEESTPESTTLKRDKDHRKSEDNPNSISSGSFSRRRTSSSINPEDVTSAPRRKQARRRTTVKTNQTSPANLLAASDNEDVNEEVFKKIDKSRLDSQRSESQIEIVPTNPITNNRSRRRKINNSSTLKSIEETTTSSPTTTSQTTSRRRRNRTTTTTVPTDTSSTSSLSSSPKSRRRIQRPVNSTTEDQFLEVNKSPKPTGRTTESRSQVSKERVLTKSSYPQRKTAFSSLEFPNPKLKSDDQDDFFDEHYKRVRNDEEKESFGFLEPDEIRRRYFHDNHDKDDVSRSDVPFDGIVRGDGDELETALPESYFMPNVLRNAPIRNVQHPETNRGKQRKNNADKYSKEDKEERSNEKSTIKYIKDPRKRLYYYVD